MDFNSIAGLATSFVANILKGGSNFMRYKPLPGGDGEAFARALTKNSSDADVTVGIEPEYAALIEKQLHAQEQNMLVTLVSNNEKTKHETAMAAVRNIRVS